MRTVGTEEHFVTDDVVEAWSRIDARVREDSPPSVIPAELDERLREVGERRIAAMDEAGLDVQVISLTSPGLHNLPVQEATRLQVVTNDRIAELVSAFPDRIEGFATLAAGAPAAAARAGTSRLRSPIASRRSPPSTPAGSSLRATTAPT